MAPPWRHRTARGSSNRSFDEERRVIADLDFARVAEERHKFDPTGRYSRPDVFAVEVDRRRRDASHFRD